MSKFTKFSDAWEEFLESSLRHKRCAATTALRNTGCPRARPVEVFTALADSAERAHAAHKAQTGEDFHEEFVFQAGGGWWWRILSPPSGDVSVVLETVQCDDDHNAAMAWEVRERAA